MAGSELLERMCLAYSGVGGMVSVLCLTWTVWVSFCSEDQDGINVLD